MLSICIQCGAEKDDAQATCSQCEFLPDSSESKSKSALLTQRYFSVDQLQTFADEIRSGAELEFDREQLETLIVLRELSRAQKKRITVFALFMGVLLLATISVACWKVLIPLWIE